MERNNNSMGLRCLKILIRMTIVIRFRDDDEEKLVFKESQAFVLRDKSSEVPSRHVLATEAKIDFPLKRYFFPAVGGTTKRMRVPE